MPPHLRRDYELALAFSDFILGAHLRYNVIYSNYEDDAMLAGYDDWKASFSFNDFNLASVLSRASGNYQLNRFLEEFLRCTKAGDDDAVDRLIVSRERQMKGDRAKLNNPQAYQYNPDAPIQRNKLDFRYYSVRRIVADIMTGLGVEA